MTYSDRELLRGIDFERMSSEELTRAKRLVAQMQLPIMAVPTRRFLPDSHGRRIDMRATLRAQLRSGGVPALRWRNPRTRHPPLVIIEQLVAPLHRGGQRPLPRRRGPVPAGQQREPIIDPV